MLDTHVISVIQRHLFVSVIPLTRHPFSRNQRHLQNSAEVFVEMLRYLSLSFSSFCLFLFLPFLFVRDRRFVFSLSFSSVFLV